MDQWKYLVDPTTFLMIAIALCTILYGAWNSIHFFEKIGSTLDIEENPVKIKTAILLPILGSVVLIILFYFLHWIGYFLKAIFTITSLTAVTFVAYPFVDRLVGDSRIRKTWDVNYLGPITTTGLISFSLAISLVLVWLVGTLQSPKNFFWITDILAICLAITALSFIRVPNLMISTIILSGFFLYDIFWVFLSSYIFKKNVMIQVATNLPSLPLVIIFPRVLEEGYSLLGVGDIVLPGIFLCYLYRFDLTNSIKFWHGYFFRAWIGYGCGLCLTILMVFFMQRGQPALLYLVPFTLLPTFVFAYIQGHLRVMWNSTAPSKVRDEEYGTPLMNIE